MNYNDPIRCDIKLYKKITQNLHKMNIKLILLNLKCNLMLKSFNEAEHPRDEKGRFSNKETCIIETPEEQKLSDKELKVTIFNYAREHFQGKKYRNKDTNIEILVSRDGLDKWASVTKTRAQTISMKKLDIMLENAVSVREKAPDRKQRNDVTGIRYFDSKITINSIPYIAHITVRETTGNQNKYYHHYLETIKLEKYKSRAQDAVPFDESPDTPLLRSSQPSSRILHPAQNKRDALLLGGFSKSIPCFNKSVNSLSNMQNLKKARNNNISNSILWLENYLIQSGKREEKNYISELSKYLEKVPGGNIKI
ncbi:hypothetical protein [Treponema pedis]|uniref:LPD3 domain-containing protein n=1 Tax=Treponema pedis TaxID=409322 RepID=UPI000414FBE5|nr:hypothetical protein [Treponema pedis]